MNKNAFDLAMFCGRFQHIHIGHEHVINTALRLADRLLILVGSAQEFCTERNPFSVSTRIEMIKNIYPEDNVIVKPLADLTHEQDIAPEWGKYVLKNTKLQMKKIPELMIYGNDEARSKWFEPEDIKDITEVVISRSKYQISATKIRGFLQNNNIDEWMKWTNPRLHQYYDKLRNELLMCESYKE